MVCPFSIGLFLFLWIAYRSSIYVLKISPLPDTCFADIFFRFMFAWYIFFTSYLYLSVTFYLKCNFSRLYLVGLCFLICPDNLCLVIGLFETFTFNATSMWLSLILWSCLFSIHLNWSFLFLPLFGLSFILFLSIPFYLFFWLLGIPLCYSF